MAVDIEAIYERYGPMVLRRCRCLLLDESDAVDAMQDTFVRLLRAKERLTDAALCSLLYRMATNVCLNQIRSGRRRPEDKMGDLLIQIAAVDELESRVFSRIRLAQLFVDESRSARVIATLHLCDGMTLEEVATATGLSVSGVRKSLRRLKGKLRAHDEAL